MTRVWQWNRPVTVREVLEDLQKERSIAYTTVMTVLDNLHQKGWVRREVVGRAYRYTAVSTRAAYSAALMNEAWSQSDNPAAALIAFFGMMSPEQREALNDAIRIVQRDAQEEPPEGAVQSRPEQPEPGTEQRVEPGTEHPEEPGTEPRAEHDRERSPERRREPVPPEPEEPADQPMPGASPEASPTPSRAPSGGPASKPSRGGRAPRAGLSGKGGDSGTGTER
nr:BlaI/MecI/CopY family transcriptional regulator [Streptomyces sp. MUM 203J]